MSQRMMNEAGGTRDRRARGRMAEKESTGGGKEIGREKQSETKKKQKKGEIRYERQTTGLR